MFKSESNALTEKDKQDMQDMFIPFEDSDWNDKAFQAAVFRRMLSRLENSGECRAIFHRLAFQLFGTAMVDD